MFNIFRKEMDWGGVPLILETGMIARQADGSVMVTYGETRVLCTAVFAKSAKPGQNFFPLTVNYQEKAFAAGKIPGGFFKREGRPSENETLVSRLIDRPLRPLFANGFLNETQVITTVLAHDMIHDPAIAAMIGASAALTLSGAPFLGPIAGCRVGEIDGELSLNPNLDHLQHSQLDLIVAGTVEGVLMVESEAKELSETRMLEAVMFAHQSLQPVINLIIDLAEDAAKEPYEMPAIDADIAAIPQQVADFARDQLVAAYDITVKQQRVAALNAAREATFAHFEAQEIANEYVAKALKSLEADIVRGSIIETGQRIDGRSTTDVRAIDCRVGLLDRAHGSALFTRGETQALVVTTLGTGQDEQIVDALAGEYRENFMLHYNFPPYSVGEAGRMGSPGRREIGHGKLAWRAIRPVLPERESFPYTIRVVSEITESNGSSSMATVCGTSMALMDAGVPMSKPCAGIAMGLIKEESGIAVLSDILGDEDHLGDMDFKVAGTQDGITSLQMDIKITSITEAIMQTALDQARAGRLHILAEMNKAINSGRAQVSANAPRITTLTIPREKIREVIGTGGKVIREICEETGAKIDIDDDGTIKVAAVDSAAGERAVAWINGIIAEPEPGKIYQGTVVKSVDFGAFVKFMGSREGLVHISELVEGRVEKTADVVSEGDTVWVQCIGIDDRGKVRLSMRVVNQETGEAIEGAEIRPERPRKSGGNANRRPRRD